LIRPDTLEALRRFHSDEGVVSAYVSVEPRLAYDPTHPATEFKGAVKRFFERRDTASWHAALERERGDLLSVVEAWRPEGRGLALFACKPAGFRAAFLVHAPIPTVVEVEASPRTGILDSIVRDYPPMIVAVVQRDRAKLLFTEQLESIELGTITSEVPRWHSQGGESQPIFQRHIAAHAHAHYKKVAEEITRAHREAPNALVALGGTEETIARFVEVLPKEILDAVIGRFPVDVKGETDEAILERARALRREHEDRRAAERVQQVIDAARAGGQGVLGLSETFRNLVQGRVRELVIAEGMTPGGAVCMNCGYFAPKSFGRCPSCGGESEVTGDVLAHVVGHIPQARVAMTRVSREDARKALEREGGIGALLRY